MVLSIRLHDRKPNLWGNLIHIPRHPNIGDNLLLQSDRFFARHAGRLAMLTGRYRHCEFSPRGRSDHSSWSNNRSRPVDCILLSRIWRHIFVLLSMVLGRGVYERHTGRKLVDLLCFAECQHYVLVQSNRFGILAHVSMLQCRHGYCQSGAARRDHYPSRSNHRQRAVDHTSC